MTKFTRESIGTLIIPRPSRSIVDAFLALEQLTPDCCDILEELGHTHGFTPATILHPVQEFMRVVGPALTILNGPGSSELWPHEYQDLFLVAQPGDVVVIAGGGHEHATGWGGNHHPHRHGVGAGRHRHEPPLPRLGGRAAYGIPGVVSRDLAAQSQKISRSQGDVDPRGDHGSFGKAWRPGRGRHVWRRGYPLRANTRGPCPPRGRASNLKRTLHQPGTVRIG